MKLFGFEITNNIGPDIKLLAGPAGVLIIIMLLTIVVVKNGYGRLVEQIETFDNTESEKQELDDRLTVLKEVRQGVLNQTDKVLVAYPNRNPATFMISQLKLLADENELSLTNIQLDDISENEGITEGELSIEAESLVYDNLLDMILELRKIAPMSNLTKAELEWNRDKQVYTGNLEISLYWSELPETLPQLDQPIEELSNVEINILNNVFGLRQPVFTELDPEGPKERELPFN